MNKENYENQNEVNETKHIEKLDEDFCLKDSDIYLKDSDFYLTEESFYPPVDNRYLQSLVEDINDEDNFVEYAKFIYDLYEEEGYYEN